MRKRSKSPVEVGEQTANFGWDNTATFAERTARFGGSMSRNGRVAGEARSVSLTPGVPMGDHSFGTYATNSGAEATIGTFGPRPPVVGAPRLAPPPAQGPQSARPDFPGSGDRPVLPTLPPPRRLGTLSGMAAASRVTSERWQAAGSVRKP
mmetsp:Transcript_84044/g.213936  ORF Transcript_84044/g.213936 Transcript_84044/m.213936 type:complete len:151 (-) Transcript_84044:120-572(-)